MDDPNTQSVVSTDLVRVQCQGISRKTGQRCTAPVVKGERYCAGHAGLGLGGTSDKAREAQAKAAATRRRQAEASKKTAAQVYREAVEANAVAFAAARVKIALDETASPADRMKAMEALENRALGRPTEHVQTEDVSSKAAEELSLAELVASVRAAQSN